MQITIRKEYFDNIETATNSLNNFFGSGFKTKNFPMIESNEQLDASVLSILSWMNNVDPTWIDGTDKVESAIERINQFAEDHDGEEDVLTTLTNDNNTSALDLINAFIGYKMLQYINDHFEAFNELMNGIFSFELFTQTSKFQKSLDIFSKPIPLDEIVDVTGDNQYQVFNEEKYVHGIFDNSQIKLPKELKFETEITRFTERNNLENVEIVVDESVQEAADINFFVDMHPENLRYHSGLKVVQISKQFEAKVNQLVSGLRGCNTTEDLKQYFANFPFSPDDFSHVVLPCILARVFDNPRKFPNQSFDKQALKKYTDSYKSILGKSDGAKRFGAYDIFSTFKADKEGTIKFIEDFLKLRLVNDEDGTITNNTLLVIFNIFDSRIYLDIMYNMLPADVRAKMAPSEDAFVKKVRGKINRNAHNGNIYKKEVPIPEEDNVQTSDQVAEYVSNVFSQTDALSVSDLMYCENYHDLIHQEINTLGDVLYNHGVSVDELDEYIGESYDMIQESSNVPPVDGSIPDYMKTRIKLSDEEDEKSGTPKGPVITDIQLPPDIPSNSYDDLANSIDTRLNGTGNLDTMLGAGYNGEISKQGGEGRVVYNITNNYTNSFNKNSNNTNTNTKNTTNNNENSTITNNKSTNTSNSNNTSNVENTTKNENSGNTTTTTTNNHDSSTHNIDSNNITTRHIQNPHNNNKNNSTVLSDTKDSNKLSNGKTIQEVFAILESEEPLSNTMSAGEPPKRDILTKALDNDKNSLAANQKIKKGLQKMGNTARATVKPISRTKQWLTNVVNSLIKRDEDKVKADMIQNPSYRSAVFKAGRIALKLGLTGAFYSINPWFGIIYAGAEGLKLADKNRLRKEVTDEFATELKILDEKIKIAREEATGYHANPDAKKRLYELIRTRDKMQQMAPQSMKSYIKSASGLY
jgi:hypothetical protein